MTFHEDYARIRVDEATKAGLNSQKVQRTLSGNKDSKTHAKNTQGNPVFENLFKKIEKLLVAFLTSF